MVVESMLTMVEQVELPSMKVDKLLNTLEWGKRMMIGLMTSNVAIELDMQVC